MCRGVKDGVLILGFDGERGMMRSMRKRGSRVWLGDRTEVQVPLGREMLLSKRSALASRPGRTDARTLYLSLRGNRQSQQAGEGIAAKAVKWQAG